MNEKLILAELRTIKMMCIANFVELQEIRRDLGIKEPNNENDFANRTAAHLEILEKRLARLIREDLGDKREYVIPV